MIILTIKKNGQTASGRTRNRINEAGPDFEFIQNLNRPGSLLLRSLKTNWFGWLPESEIKIISSKEIN